MHILVHRNKRYCVSIINIVLDKYIIIMKVSNFQEDNTRQMHDVCTAVGQMHPERKYESFTFLT